MWLSPTSKTKMLPFRSTDTACILKTLRRMRSGVHSIHYAGGCHIVKVTNIVCSSRIVLVVFMKLLLLLV
jgi:hypothetical protein